MATLQNTPREFDNPPNPESKFEVRSFCLGYDGYWMEILHYGKTKIEAIQNANRWVSEHIISAEIKQGTVVLSGIRHIA